MTGRVTPSLAHILPLAVFILLNAVPGLMAVDNEVLPWWRRAPEHWVYPLQTILVGGMLWAFRRHYTFRPLRGFGLGTVLGILGIAAWLIPGLIYQKLLASGITPAEWLEWLGIAPRLEGFNPDIFKDQPAAYGTAIILRLVRMTVVVAFAEEIFWRGFLMRYVQADGRGFQKIAFGRHDWRAYGIVTGCFMLAHQPVDWLGALIFGSMMYWLAVRTKSLAACVLMHAVANLLLGIYVLQTKQWGFW